ERLFRNYLYFSSFSQTMLKHAEVLSGRLIDSRNLSADSLVVEVASNDGYLLQYYHKDGIPVLGIEPALNIARVAEGKGIRTISEFFGNELANRLVLDGIKADVIHANNVLAHVADLPGVAEGMAILLKPGGVAVIEVPYVRKMIENVEFDTIYHEHLCYFSLTALDRLFRQHKLQVQDVEQLAIHGGSLRVYVSAIGEVVGDSVTSLLLAEKSCGMNDVEFYRDFGQRVSELGVKLKSLLSELKSQGKSIAAYGASAKGSTLLNYLGIGAETLDFVVDRSTVKQGMYTSGNHLPIYDPAMLIEKTPDYVLLLTWNFAEEILEQQAQYRNLGGKFIIPIPEPVVI
ncbi:MAG: methyltransferase domain-containing protein, partial [Candidatus Obscuribacterales bacterium]|nr:methyltransferase domain-containing protein [Candidatus Obscuribacterales bacterium]